MEHPVCFQNVPVIEYRSNRVPNPSYLTLIFHFLDKSDPLTYTLPKSYRAKGLDGDE
jgi:hypothetical protein